MTERECDICGQPIQPGDTHTVESQPGDKDGEACGDCYSLLTQESR